MYTICGTVRNSGSVWDIVYLRETDGKHAEVSLEACVDGEAASGGVHGGNVLHVLYILQGLFLTVVPVLIVQMLLGNTQ